MIKFVNLKILEISKYFIRSKSFSIWILGDLPENKFFINGTQSDLIAVWNVISSIQDGAFREKIKIGLCLLNEFYNTWF